jgi:hypothetical protein
LDLRGLANTSFESWSMRVAKETMRFVGNKKPLANKVLKVSIIYSLQLLRRFIVTDRIAINETICEADLTTNSLKILEDRST